jgi:hypothetical protein
MLAELELPDDDAAEDGQLELFTGDAAFAPVPSPTAAPAVPVHAAGAGAAFHRVVTVEGREVDGTWDEIVSHLRATSGGPLRGESVGDFMAAVATQHFGAPAAQASAYDAESFIRASAAAGLLRIVR